MAAAPRDDGPLASLRSRVLLANISPGHISTPTVKGFLECSRNGHPVYLDDAPPYLDDARNKIAATFLHLRGQLDAEYLLFVDSDIGFTQAHVDTLLTPLLHADFSPVATPVLCGVYYNTFVEPVPGDDPDAHAWVDPVAYEWVERNFPQDDEGMPPRWSFRRLSTSALATLPPHPTKWNPRAPKHSLTRKVICEVAAAGTGFMLIHHSILTTLAAHHDDPTPYFAEPVVNKVHLGEDMAFCHRVRALGYPVLVNRACVVLHGKMVWLP